MTDLKEAAMLSLEALNKLRDFPGAFEECLAATKALRAAIAMEPAPEAGSWYEASDIDEMVRDLDVAMNGEGAAPQAKLCDLMPQLIQRLTEPVQEPEQWAMNFIEEMLESTPAHSLLASQVFHALRQQLGERPTQPAAQPAKQERPQNCGTGYCSCIECVMEQEQGKPVAEDKVKQLVKQCTHRDVDGNWYVDGVQLVHATCFALDAIMCRNTTPQQRKPLTNEQIAEITVGFYGSAIHHDDYEFARAIEAAHGIKEST